MFLQNSNNVLMELNPQLASPLFAQSPITLRRNLGERMNSNKWLFQPPMLSGVKSELLNRSLWQQFHKQNTEMIITKSGRRMFPSVQINVSGLQKRENYFVLLEIAPASDRRHKYCGYESNSGNMGGWSFAGPAEPQHPFNRRIYVHPDSPAMGTHWMDNSINFNKVKLTNNINDHNNNINMVLTSMHKYVPKIWIIHCSSAKNYSELFSYPATSFVFKETEFIAVTAYQNDNITKLKIDNNPFAKGFRETGQSRFKRKYHRKNHQAQSDVSRDEGGSVFSFDSESNQVASERSSVASERGSVTSNSENPTHEAAERLTIESSTDASDDARPIAVNSSRSSESVADEVPFHRPWLDLPRNQVIPSSNYISHHSHYLYMYSQYVASQNYMRLRDYHFRNYCYQFPWDL